MTGLQRIIRMAGLMASTSLLLAIATPSAAQNQQDGMAARRVAVTGNCATTASKYKTSFSAIDDTTSTTYQNIAESGIRFVQGGTKPGCVRVAFSAEARANTDPGQLDDQVMYVRPFLDGDTLCQPNAVAFVASDPDFTQLTAHAMTFVCTDVAPGSHTVRMQYLNFGEGEVHIARRTLFVDYVK